MRIGIVGSEEAKFTPLGKERAQAKIRELIEEADSVCSGECHLGGVDIWAHDIADWLGKPFTPYPPATQKWEGGYKQRNLQIAYNSDKVVCITVDKLPPDYKGMTFGGCYHCTKNWPEAPSHIKSGGCWTMYQAKKAGKEWQLIVIENE